MANKDYTRIERAIRFLDAHTHEQPDLGTVAQAAGLSVFHFQRLFRRWTGISPKRFVQFLTADRARRLLAQSRGTLDAALASGLSGPGRLHDLLVNVYAATPGELRRGGADLVIRHGFAPTSFGECLVGLTARGLCHLAFVAPGGRSAALEEMAGRWPRARLAPARKDAEAVARRLFTAAGRAPSPLTLHLHGTNFQIRVWEALLRIPPGAVTSYESLARHLGTPRATRAVASAVAANPIGVLIPCHRVIRKTGAFGEYHWGKTRKQALLAWEAAHTGDTTSPARTAGD
jgi:AraC family transcriptional regulator of adaptative response/methylated-DNA-[protein]-cysteine methyltransferase